MKPFIERLSEWTDLDYAMHELALAIGMIKEEDGSFAVEFKWIYWSNNKYGEALKNMLFKMVDIELLEYDDEELKLRANSTFSVNLP